jgi:HD superfamily phosphodiesterase
MNSANDNPEAEEIDDDEVEEILEGGEDVDLDRMYKEADRAKRRAAKTRGGEPAWKVLERRREERLVKEQISDFDDYDIDNVELSLTA